MTTTEKKASSKKRSRKQYTYRHRTNAIDITLYSLNGDTIDAAVREQFKKLAEHLATENGLVINVATT